MGIGFLDFGFLAGLLLVVIPIWIITK